MPQLHYFALSFLLCLTRNKQLNYLRFIYQVLYIYVINLSPRALFPTQNILNYMNNIRLNAQIS
jgi:hypothetical protein